MPLRLLPRLPALFRHRFSLQASISAVTTCKICINSRRPLLTATQQEEIMAAELTACSFEAQSLSTSLLL
jgi:hypothetical protein